MWWLPWWSCLGVLVGEGGSHHGQPISLSAYSQPPDITGGDRGVLLLQASASPKAEWSRWGMLVGAWWWGKPWVWHGELCM